MSQLPKRSAPHVCIECGHTSVVAGGCPQCPDEPMLPVNAPETQALQEQHARVSQVPGAMWGAFLLASIAAGTAALGKFDWGLVALTAAPFLFLVGRQALQRHRQRMVMRIDA